MTGKSSIFFFSCFPYNNLNEDETAPSFKCWDVCLNVSNVNSPAPPKKMSNSKVVECCQYLEWINQSVVKIKIQNFNSKSKQCAFDHFLTFFCVKLYPILYYCHSNITHKTQKWREQLSTEKNTCFKGKTSNYNNVFIKWHLFLFYFFILKNSPYSLSL